MAARGVREGLDFGDFNNYRILIKPNSLMVIEFYELLEICLMNFPEMPTSALLVG
jgi:RIO-like serine/threonine protein kinase